MEEKKKENTQTAVSTYQGSHLLPSQMEWKIYESLAIRGVQSGLLPSWIKNESQAFMIALKGRELGIPPMQAFSHIYLVEGKPSMSAELMLAQIFKNVPKSKIVYERSDSTGCVVKGSRDGETWLKVEFTEADAKRAGLLGRQTKSGKPTSWDTYPTAMYRARAISALARALFPDALGGVSYTPEELGASVNEDGVPAEFSRVDTKEEKSNGNNGSNSSGMDAGHKSEINRSQEEAKTQQEEDHKEETKTEEPPQAPPKEIKVPAEEEPKKTPVNTSSPAVIAKIQHTMKKHGWDNIELSSALSMEFNVKTVQELKFQEDIDYLLRIIEKNPMKRGGNAAHP